MTCEETREWLDDLVDGTVDDPARAAALEQHLAECPGCRAEREAAQALIARVRALPAARTPARDLWPDVARQIRARSPARRWAGPALLAAAAALVLVAGTLGPRRLAPRGPDRPAPIIARSGGPAADAGLALAAADPEAPLAEEQRYQESAAALRAALQARRGSLSPATLEVVEHNLAVIDEALREIRRALRADPGNLLLSQLLSSTNQQKLAVLQRMLELVEHT
jgi:hypothetical protein